MSETNANDNDGGVVAVSGYQRSDGTKVSEHARAPPGNSAKRPSESNDDGQKQKGESAPKKANAAGGEEKEFNEEDAPLAEGGDGRMSMTVRELLELDLKERQQAALVAMSIANDKEKAAIVAHDEMERKEKEKADKAQTDQHKVPEKPQLKDLLKQLQDIIVARKNDATCVPIHSIIKNALAGHYNSRGPGRKEGSYGLKSLVPHLRSVSLWNMSSDVEHGKYDI